LLNHCHETVIEGMTVGFGCSEGVRKRGAEHALDAIWALRGMLNRRLDGGAPGFDG